MNSNTLAWLFPLLAVLGCSESNPNSESSPGAAGAGPRDTDSPGATTGSGASSGLGDPADPSMGSGGSVGTETGGGAPIIEGPPPPAITITEFPIPEPSQPGALVAGPDGNLWFTHLSTAPSAVTRASSDGQSFDIFETRATGTGPQGIAAGPDGNVWYAKQGGIIRATPDGGIRETNMPDGGDSGDIVTGPDGNLWLTQPLNGKITRVTTDLKFQDFAIPTPDSGPRAITVGPEGALWFTEAAAASNKIARITVEGDVTEFPIPTAASNPLDIALGPDGNLWFTEHDGRQIGRITPSGEITEFGIPSGNSPSRITAGPDGNLWITLSGSANAIARVTVQGQVSEYQVPTAGADPHDISLGPDGNLWFTELSANKLARVSDLSGGGDRESSDGAGGQLVGDTPCSVDTDCQESGRSCGGDVCHSIDKVCVLSVSGDTGTCSSDQQCWCQGAGATCDGGQCSFIESGGSVIN